MSCSRLFDAFMFSNLGWGLTVSRRVFTGTLQSLVRGRVSGEGLLSLLRGRRSGSRTDLGRAHIHSFPRGFLCPCKVNERPKHKGSRPSITNSQRRLFSFLELRSRHLKFFLLPLFLLAGGQIFSLVSLFREVAAFREAKLCVEG